MACTPSSELTIIGTGTDQDNAAVPQIFVNAAETFLFYMNGTGVQKWDISVPATPAFDTELAISDSGILLSAFKDDVLYVLSYDTDHHVLHSIDVTTSPPTELDSVALAQNDGFPLDGVTIRHGMEIGGDRLYMIDLHPVNNSNIVHIVDISNPSAMSLLASPDFELAEDVSEITNGSITNVVVDPNDGTIVYLFIDSPALGNVIAEFDTTTPSSPSRTGLLDSSTLDDYGFDSNVTFALIEGNYIFSEAEGVGGVATTFLLIVNRSSMSIESITEIASTRNTAAALAYKDNNIYVSLPQGAATPGQPDGLISVWNVSDRSAPSLCVEYTTSVDPGSGGLTIGASNKLYRSTYTGAFVNGTFEIYDASTTISGGGGGGDPGFTACKTLGSSSNYLFIADFTNSALKIYDVGDPTTPSLEATLVLNEAPTDLALSDTIVYAVTGSTLYGISLQTITGPQVIASVSAMGTKVTASGGYIVVSGPSAGISVFQINDDESDLDLIIELPAESGGSSLVTFTRLGAIFADLDGDELATLWNFSIGGFTCHHIFGRDIYAEFLQAEILRARHLLVKGEVVAHGLVVAGSGDGSFSGNLKVHGNIIIGGTQTGGAGTSLTDHLNDTTDAHDASAISFTPAGTIAATDVQAAIEEVASEGGGDIFAEIPGLEASGQVLPASPNAYDDEFDSGSIAAWDRPNSSTETITSNFLPSWLLFDAVDAFWRPIVQDVTGTWSVRTYFELAKPYNVSGINGDGYAGIVILPATDGAVEAWCLGNDSNTFPPILRAELWTNFSTFGSQRHSINWYGVSLYLEVEWNGTNLIYKIGTNGLDYSDIISFTPGFTPGRVGIGARGAGAVGYFDFARKV